MKTPNYARKIELLRQKADAERELDAIQQQEEYLSTLPLNFQVVEMMHSLHCHADHTEGCGFFYESWEKPGQSRLRMVKQAEELIERVREHLMVISDGVITDARILKTIEVCQERYW